ncbi:MAG TPA: GNVR domain-containing protein [Steroidobacteraceae bacterium]|jgi:succinoglycan biosynthesis transport protein ExoP|nr:GNVR domain-containing protein [Steroidobacteraceae bacterium]
MSVRLLLDIVKSRLFLIMLTMLITVGIAGALTFLEPKRYLASTSLVLNLEQESPFERTSVPAALSSNYLTTQMDIIRSQKVALRVVEQEGLAKQAGWKEAYAESGSTQAIEPWIAQQIMQNVDAEPLQNSRVVNVTYLSLAPADAARMANAYAKAYMATSLELAIEPARRNAAWFDQQLKAQRARLDAARSKMSDMQVEKGVVALDEKLTTETNRLDEISRNLVEAQAATAAARGRQLGVNHPEYQSALQRERALAGALAAQKANIVRLTHQREDVDTIAREVQSEQDNYTATLQAYYKTAMESQFVQTNIAVLSPAFAPEEPASPNVPLNMISAVVLGLFLGLVAAFTAEMMNPRTPSMRLRRQFVEEPITEV